MKIFISWSGETSKNTAELLKKWIPCFFESAEVFFSSEDIEKGQNWNNRITEELADCNYGIVCLTHENKSAPWINFEAGALAKAFDSRVTALLVGINPSDIQGPLSMFQATKLVEDDVFKLIKSINNCLEHPRNEDTLKDLFDALWEKINKDFKEIVENISIEPKASGETGRNEILESILQVVREQSRILSDPENILPKEYLSKFIADNKATDINRNDLKHFVSAVLVTINGMFDEDFYVLNEKEKQMFACIKRIVSFTRTLIERQRIVDSDNEIKALMRKINNIENRKWEFGDLKED